MDVVGVIYMVVVLDIDLEVGYMVVLKVVRVVARTMQVMVDMAILVEVWWSLRWYRRKWVFQL